MNKICNYCGEGFFAVDKIYRVRKYCSVSCGGKAHKGAVAWNKGTKGVMKPNKTSFKKEIPLG